MSRKSSVGALAAPVPCSVMAWAIPPGSVTQQVTPITFRQSTDGSEQTSPRDVDRQLAPGRVAIGVCTARRPTMLADLLGDIAQLDLVERDPRRVSLVIVDNSTDASARGVVEDFAMNSSLDVMYLHEPNPGLSRARNLVMDTAAERADLLAIIDDDERPDPVWLDRLVESQRVTGAPLLTGPVYPLLPEGAPVWFSSGGFLDNGVYPDGARLLDGITGNALFHLPTLRAAGLRFDERFGRSGGEDQLFFRQAAAKGMEIRFVARATVHETVPLERLTLRYLVRRELRKGNTLGLLARYHPELGEDPIRRLGAAGWWLLTGISAGVHGLVTCRRIQSRRGLLRCVRAAGMIGGLLGWRYLAY